MNLRFSISLVLLATPVFAFAAMAKGQSQTQSPAMVQSLPACTTDDLSLSFDGERGAFDGMSHSGTLLMLHNVGPGPCRLERLPKITYLDADGKTLPIQRETPVGMHPGPVELPLGLALGAEATSALYWVEGNVYPNGQCYDVATVGVNIGNGTLSGPLKAKICGQEKKPANVEQPPLALDPVLDSSEAGQKSS